MSSATLLKVQVSRIKFLNQLHSFHNHVDVVFELCGQEPIKMEGISIPDFEEDKTLNLAKVEREIDIIAPDIFAKRTICVQMRAKKFKKIGTDVLLCKGYIPLSKFLDDSRKQSQKMKVLLHTPADNVQLAVMYVNLNESGFRREGSANDFTGTGLALI